jgi:hypothetical protein
VSDRPSERNTRAGRKPGGIFIPNTARGNRTLGQLGQHQRKQEANLRPLPFSISNKLQPNAAAAA